ncbi:DUF554 domain-containing protein [uncultured Treponema sp.]|uniref:DUF554 domain-containing protein n=1 Tax=uncultured Treponema sp. TaxID=162155 RepID=UPI002593328F|nr:DUF554 domain-containing protein [uncultured Treponema sp.]
MTAVFVNCAAVILGSILGLLFSGRIGSRMEEVIRTGAGIVTLVLGLQMAFEFQNVVYFTLAVIAGGITGTALDIDAKILCLGKLLERLVYRNKVSAATAAGEEVQPLRNFAHAFLNSSVLFCVGAMAILGSLKAGIEHDYSVIFTKSILDGFMAISFAAAMGAGTIFSALSILVYQGALTLLSTLAAPYCTEQMIAEITGSGGALICMIGINLLGIRNIKTANYLPAVLFSVIFVLLDPYISQILSLFR